MESKIITKEERVSLVTEIVEALSIGDEDLKQDLYLLALSAPQETSQDELHRVIMSTLSERTRQREDSRQLTKSHQEYINLCNELIKRGVDEIEDEENEDDCDDDIDAGVYIPHLKLRDIPVREIKVVEFPVGIRGASFDELIISHLLGRL